MSDAEALIEVSYSSGTGCWHYTVKVPAFQLSTSGCSVAPRWCNKATAIRKARRAARRLLREAARMGSDDFGVYHEVLRSDGKPAYSTLEARIAELERDLDISA